MKFILDQNVPRMIKNWLIGEKPVWEVEHTSDLGFSVEADEKIFDIAQEKEAIIITFDEDFSDIRMFQLPHAGIIRLNIWPTTLEETQKALKRLISELSDEELKGALVIIDKTKIRYRKL